MLKAITQIIELLSDIKRQLSKPDWAAIYAKKYFTAADVALILDVSRSNVLKNKYEIWGLRVTDTFGNKYLWEKESFLKWIENGMVIHPESKDPKVIAKLRQRERNRKAG